MIRLNSYKLSNCEAIKSIVISEYGLRHLAHSKHQGRCMWGHRLIAVIELCPGIGQIATLIEFLIAKCLLKTHSSRITAKPTLTHSSRITAKPTLNWKKEWLFKGSQAGCNGALSAIKVEALRAKLQVQSPEVIQFNSAKVSDQIEGGTCSAMSLELIDTYFKLRNKWGEKTESLIKELEQIGPKFTVSSEEIKHRQAAFNTIEVVQNDPKKDYSKEKIQALSNYHGLAVDHSSKEVDLLQTGAFENFSKEVENLPKGVYILRILKPSPNEKLEEHGHSVVFIKENNFSLYYDPNYGLRLLNPSKRSNLLQESIQVMYRSFEINLARFYRVSKIAQATT